MMSDAEEKGQVKQDLPNDPTRCLKCGGRLASSSAYGCVEGWCSQNAAPLSKEVRK